MRRSQIKMVGIYHVSQELGSVYPPIFFDFEERETLYGGKKKKEKHVLGEVFSRVPLYLYEKQTK